MSTAELHTLTGAYALHALPEDERRAFERHLAECEACGQEVAELSATASRLALAVAAAPPRGMRDEVLRRIATVRQEAPGHGVPGRVTGSAPGRTGRWSRWALAACIAAAAALGGVALWQSQVARGAQQEADRAHRQNESVARVLSAPDARTAPGRPAAGGRGTVVVSASVNRAVFLASGMAPPPRGKVYQLWFADGGTMRPAGLMDPDAADGSVLMDGPVDRATGVGITVEPAGGSARPTSEPLALMAFPAA
ncbi:anti-sigma factor [Streptomyces sp. NBC_00102]|uniref:anti-sigma factor n=1 Tax=Streptomyces sp. NBC_00102 TaxID=2975652 RepID=UPI002250C67E|nr:anti-sigma factor [Streptomyces sp. NBC_00102]MCX5396008.1 anti-sigma factor [Streptomyces sp. NBC_00102]